MPDFVRPEDVRLCQTIQLRIESFNAFQHLNMYALLILCRLKFILSWKTFTTPLRRSDNNWLHKEIVFPQTNQKCSWSFIFRRKKNNSRNITASCIFSLEITKEEMFVLTQTSFSQKKKLLSPNPWPSDYRSDTLTHWATGTHVGNGSLNLVLIDRISGICPAN